MKKVFADNDMVRHVWAQQNQESGRNPKGSLSFRGTTLYSYNTPIANFVTIGKVKACLITTQTFSVTTSGKHMPRASDISNCEVFYSHFVKGGDNGRGGYTKADLHNDNIKEYAKRYARELTTLARAKKHAEYQVTRVLGIRDEAFRYAEFFEVLIDKADFPEPTEEELQEAKARAHKITAAQAKATRERAAQKAANLQSAINAFMSGETNKLPWEFKMNASAAQKALVAPYIIQLWRAGEWTRKIDFLSPDNGALLRLADGEIQTSQGAVFPVADGKAAWPLITKVKQLGVAVDYHMHGYYPKLGHFNIDKVFENGDVKAGCHYVKFGEIERMATALGLK